MDKELFIRACREGGHAIERVLRMLDRSYYALLHRECRRVVHDADAAHDLVQETFIKVWQRCATFQGDSEVLPWVRVILRHNILDRVRRSGRTVSLDDDPAIVHEVEQRLTELAGRRDPTPPDAAHARELADVFTRCWARFATDCPEHAAVIAWIVEDGLCNDEIAELLDRTPGATRELVSQCRKRARMYFAEWYDLAFSTS